MYEDLFTFIKELYPSENPVPLHAPRFLGKEKAYLNECIDSTFVSYVGPFVKKLESQIASFAGAKHAIATCNGTAALHLSLVVAGVGVDDEVLLPTLTFVATANAVTYTGANCVFVDSEPDSLGMCPAKLSSFLEDFARKGAGGECVNRVTGRRIAACVPVHVFGHPCRIGELISICDRYGIPVIEDAAEALGSRVEDRHCGTMGLAGVLSFNGNKTLTTGGGGMILTNDDRFAEAALSLSTTAKVAHPYRFQHDRKGFNYRMPNVNAAIGCAQMEQIKGTLSDKRDTASKYRSFLSETDLSFVDEPAGCKSNFWLNAVLTHGEGETTELIESAMKSGIQMRPVWDLMHRLSMYAKCMKTQTEIAENLADRIVCLPSSVKCHSKTAS